MPEKTLTKVEYELMEILWRIGQGTVHEVLSHLPKKRALAYTSVSTILRILEQKKFVRAVKEGKQHRYQPIFSKTHFTDVTLKKLLSLYDGNPTSLVAHLVSQKLSKSELEKLQQLLDAKKRELEC